MNVSTPLSRLLFPKGALFVMIVGPVCVSSSPIITVPPAVVVIPYRPQVRSLEVVASIEPLLNVNVAPAPTSMSVFESYFVAA